MSHVRCSRLAAALSLLLGAGLAFPAPDPYVSPVQPYYDLLVAASVGDADAALAVFDTGARVVAGPQCTPAAPCIGHAAIRAGYLVPLLAGAAVLPLRDARFDGHQLRTRGECLAVAQPGGHVIEFGGGRIRSLVAEPENPGAAAPVGAALSPR
ncbi:MAG: hypothetical protein KF788_19810 [Piscinibacter sp.]|nr:hypothetical protein [Piscinibacter sp.]